MSSPGVQDACKAAREGKLEELQSLASQGVPLSTTGNNANGLGCQPIHDAIHGNNLPALKFLHSKGVPLNVETATGWQPIHFAAYRGHLEILQWLHEKNVPLDAVAFKTGKHPVHYASESGHADVVRWLHGQGVDINARDKSGSTSLELLCALISSMDRPDKERVELAQWLKNPSRPSTAVAR